MTHKVRVYPHNDLLNLAHYHRSVINGKIENGEQDALSLDCMSCIIALSFGVEAFINFIGSNRVHDWRERQPFIDKIKEIYKAIGGSFNKTIDPYLTIWQLKELRDSMAHGQPVENDVSVSSREELWAEMRAPWGHCLNQEFINHAYAQVKIWQTELRKMWGTSIGSTITSARGVSI